MSRGKEKSKTRNMNFRETRSERSATNSFRNFHKEVKRFYIEVKNKLYKKNKI